MELLYLLVRRQIGLQAPPEVGVSLYHLQQNYKREKRAGIGKYRRVLPSEILDGVRSFDLFLGSELRLR